MITAQAVKVTIEGRIIMNVKDDVKGGMCDGDDGGSKPEARAEMPSQKKVEGRRRRDTLDDV